MADISSILSAARKPMRAGRLRHDPTRSVLDAFVLEIQPGRAMILMDDSVDLGSFPIDSVVNMEVGREIWLAEIVGRVAQDDCHGMIANIRYRLPNGDKETWANNLVELPSAMPDRRETSDLRFLPPLSA